MFFLSCLSLLSLPPVTAQTPGSSAARRGEILAMVLDYGEANYDEQTHLVRDNTAQPSVAEGSLEYAVALFTTGAMPERAAALTNAVLAAQVASGKSRDRGAFPWHLGEPGSDVATAELAPWLAYLSRHLRDKLPAETQARLAASLSPALAAVSRLPVDRTQTSDYLRTLAAQATLSTALAEGTARTDWASGFAGWVRLTEQKGLLEFDSPSFYALDIAALQWLQDVAAEPRAQTKAAEALEYLYRDLALRYHPKAGRTAGAGARVLERDLSGMGAGRFVLFAAFGQPELPAAPPFAMFLALPGFTPNAETIDTATRLDVPRTIQTRNGLVTTTTYVNPLYSLGTMTGPVNGETAPVVLTYPQPDAPSAYCSVRPTPARVAAVQKESRALVDLDFDQIGSPGRVQAQVDVHLGPQSALSKVLVSGSLYYDATAGTKVTYPVAVASGTQVVTERAGVFTAFTIALAAPAESRPWDLAGKPGVLEWVKPLPTGEDELVLHISARQDDMRQAPRDNYRVAFAVEMAATDSVADFDTFVAQVQKSRLRKDLSARKVKVGERNANPFREPAFGAPVERGDWIFEIRVVQDLQYASAQDSLALTEDLQKNQVITQSIDGQDERWDFLYRSPSLNEMPGEPLNAVFRPPPPPPPPPPAQPTPAPHGKKKHK